MTLTLTGLILLAVAVTRAQYHGSQGGNSPPYQPQYQEQEIQQYQEAEPQHYQQPRQSYSEPQHPLPPVPVILMHKQALSTDGAFNYAFAADNGLKQGESISPDGTRTGSYSYVDPTGNTIKVRYTAGKDGFRVVEGDHLPKAPAPQIPAGPTPAQYNPQPARYSAPPAPVYNPAPAYEPESPRQYNFGGRQAQYQQTSAAFPSQHQNQPVAQGPSLYNVQENYSNPAFRSTAPATFPPAPQQYQHQPHRAQQPDRQQPHSFGGGYAFEFAG